MDYVLVNGVPVIEQGKMTGALPGKVLRGPDTCPTVKGASQRCTATFFQAMSAAAFRRAKISALPNERGRRLNMRLPLQRACSAPAMRHPRFRSVPMVYSLPCPGAAPVSNRGPASTKPCRSTEIFHSRNPTSHFSPQSCPHPVALDRKRRESEALLHLPRAKCAEAFRREGQTVASLRPTARTPRARAAKFRSSAFAVPEIHDSSRRLRDAPARFPSHSHRLCRPRLRS